MKGLKGLKVWIGTKAAPESQALDTHALTQAVAGCFTHPNFTGKRPVSKCVFDRTRSSSSRRGVEPRRCDELGREGETA